MFPYHFTYTLTLLTCSCQVSPRLCPRRVGDVPLCSPCRRSCLLGRIPYRDILRGRQRDSPHSTTTCRLKGKKCQSKCEAGVESDVEPEILWSCYPSSSCKKIGQVYHQCPHKNCQAFFVDLLDGHIENYDIPQSFWIVPSPGAVTVAGFEPFDKRTFRAEEAPGDIDVLVVWLWLGSNY